MSRTRRSVPGTRREQLEALDRRLIRIFVVLAAAAAALELLRGPGFSVPRFVLTVAVVALGLLFGRTLGKLVFLKRREEES